MKKVRCTCDFGGSYLYESCPVHPMLDRTPTTEPTESEGKVEKCECGYIPSIVCGTPNCYQSQFTSTAPPAESVEDAKVLLPCPFCGADGRIEKFDEMGENPYPDYQVDCSSCPVATYMQPTEEAAIKVWNTRDSKQIERQTPDIISRFVEEVVKNANDRKWRELWDDKRESGYSLQERLSWAMQTVKARRSGGGKDNV